MTLTDAAHLAAAHWSLVQPIAVGVLAGVVAGLLRLVAEPFA